MPIEKRYVIDVTQTVCCSLLGDATDVAPNASPEEAEPVIANVRIDGAWQGAVEVHVAAPLAMRLTREVLQVEPASTDDPDVADIVGEVANMIGGNLKALLPEPCTMSVPSRGAASAEPDQVERERFSVDGAGLEVVVKRAVARGVEGT